MKLVESFASISIWKTNKGRRILKTIDLAPSFCAIVIHLLRLLSHPSNIMKNTGKSISIAFIRVDYIMVLVLFTIRKYT